MSAFPLLLPLGLNKTRITYKLLQLARKVLSRSSDGRKGRACKDRRMCWRSQGRVGISHVEKQIIESWLLWSQKSKHLFLLLWLKWLSISIFFKKNIWQVFLTGIHNKTELTPQTFSRPQERNQQPPQDQVQPFYPHSNHVSSPYSAEVEVQH